MAHRGSGRTTTSTARVCTGIRLFKLRTQLLDLCGFKSVFHIAGASDIATTVLTSPSRLRSLSITCEFCPPKPSVGLVSLLGAGEVPSNCERRSSRRAHLGGLSLDGNTQAIFARRQLEHGEVLSQRTLRRRQMTQLRNFGAAGGELVVVVVVGVACFSEGEAEPTAAPVVGLGSMLLMLLCVSATEIGEEQLACVMGCAPDFSESFSFLFQRITCVLQVPFLSRLAALRVSCMSFVCTSERIWGSACEGTNPSQA